MNIITMLISRTFQQRKVYCKHCRYHRASGLPGYFQRLYCIKGFNGRRPTFPDNTCKYSGRKFGK